MLWECDIVNYINYNVDKKPYLVGISGSSGSGKTFFLKTFLEHFQKEEITFLSLDDYYNPPGKLTYEENVLYNFDVPNSFDERQWTSDIQQLMSGKTIHKKEYTFNNLDTEPSLLEIHPAPIILVEGILVYHFEEIAQQINLKLFLDVDEEVALRRRMKRDIEERNYTYEDVMYKWTNHVLPSYRTYLLPHKDLAHQVILNNVDIPENIVRVTEELSNMLKRDVLGY